MNIDSGNATAAWAHRQAAQIQVERLERELELLRHTVHIDWRELHELEKLIDAKILLALAKRELGI